MCSTEKLCCVFSSLMNLVACSCLILIDDHQERLKNIGIVIILKLIPFCILTGIEYLNSFFIVRMIKWCCCKSFCSCGYLMVFTGGLELFYISQYNTNVYAQEMLSAIICICCGIFTIGMRSKYCQNDEDDTE